MILVAILSLSVLGSFLAGEHFHSYMAGFSVATLSVGVCYWVAFRSTKYPEMAFLLLLCGMFAKVALTVIGVMWGLERDLIGSPFIFALSYLFFSIAATYSYYRYREFVQTRIEQPMAVHPA
ncbi:NADH:ubiquinone oxidoreductase [Parasalinivibrio latis]|uniref:NADH:ubiquinone oxidoreductase n=1 Tax=Parasalinivibrio latis TaxID=2952610 RepID=UPI0030E564FE